MVPELSRAVTVLGRLCTPPGSPCGISPLPSPSRQGPTTSYRPHGVQVVGPQRARRAPAPTGTRRRAGRVISELQMRSCQRGGEEFTSSRGSQGRFQGRGDFEADLEGWRGSSDAGKGRALGQRRQENATSLKVREPPRSRRAGDTWPGSFCLSGTWARGISLRKPNLSTPWAPRRKTEARVSLAPSAHRPLQPSGCCDIQAACVNSTGRDCR